MNRTPLQESLARFLAERGWSMRELSLRAGLNETAVKAIFAGKSVSPREQTMRALATALGCRLADLIGEAEIADPVKRELLEAYEVLDRQGRDMLLRLARSLRRDSDPQDDKLRAAACVVALPKAASRRSRK